MRHEFRRGDILTEPNGSTHRVLFARDEVRYTVEKISPNGKRTVYIISEPSLQDAMMNGEDGQWIFGRKK